MFCAAILLTKSFAAFFNASMRFVLSLLPMGSSIEPEASSTSTISSGVVEVEATFEVDESAESAVMNAELPRFICCPLLTVIVSSADTVLSVQIRPILDVSLPTTACQSLIVDGSVTEERPFPPPSAKAKPPPKHTRASAKAIASNGRIRFIFDPQSCFRLPAHASPDAAKLFNTRGYLRTVQPTFAVRRKALQLNRRR